MSMPTYPRRTPLILFAGLLALCVCLGGFPPVHSAAAEGAPKAKSPIKTKAEAPAKAKASARTPARARETAKAPAKSAAGAPSKMASSKTREKAKAPARSKDSAKTKAPARGGSAETRAGTKVQRPRGSTRDLARQLGLTVRRVVIDPGHGGKDPGAMANGVREKEVNLALSGMLAAELKKRGFEVFMTRTTDIFLPLGDRTARANSRKADLFVSIHVNANEDSRLSGIEVYSLNTAGSGVAAHVAARENSVAGRTMADLETILAELLTTAKLKESRDLAGLLLDAAVDLCGPTCGLKNHGVREAPFYVLMGARMPAVLVEVGYATNPAEAKLLKSKSYLRTLARGLAEGIAAYRKRLERHAGI